MKAISLIKLLTLVCFLVVGVGAVESFAATASKSDVDEETNCASYENAKDCENWKADYKRKQSKDEKKELKSECKQALKEYDDAMKKTDEECGRLNTESNQACRDKAKSCAKGLDSFGSSEPDSETAAGSIVKLIGIYGQMQGVESGTNPAANGCVIENDDKAQAEEEKIDDKVTRLREEIQDLKDKSTEADNKFNEKKQDVEKEMHDIEVEADKAKFEKQTQAQKEAGQMQKAIMASEKKRKDNLVTIADLQVDLANFSFAHQKINLTLSDASITKECRDRATATLEAKMKGTVDPKTGKEVKPKFTLQQSAQFKKDLKFAESNCLQEKALVKQETIKSLIDSKRKVQVKIDNLKASNDDEAKAIENEMKQMEALKNIAAEEEKKAIDAKFKKLAALNQSVLDMEKHTADKKKTYDEKAKAKEDQISKLLLDRQKVRSKFAKVSGVVSESGRAASRYVNQCCSSKTASENHSDCSRVLSAEPESKTATRKSTSGTKK